MLKQPFVTSDDAVDLADVKNLLAYNGFENTLRNELPTNNYYNKELGLILEDIQDENVIVKANTLSILILYSIQPFNRVKIRGTG